MEGFGGVGVVVDDTVGVAVETAIAGFRSQVEARGSTLLGFDEVGAALAGMSVCRGMVETCYLLLS